MKRIAWFGTGLMGTAFVEGLRTHGHDVVAWNRTPEKAQALERVGARAERDAREAARGAARLHIILSDDVAVDGLLANIAGSIEDGAIVIDHSTVAPGPTVKRFDAMTSRGIAFLHAPVFMSPAGVREGNGMMLVSGPEAVYGKVRDELAEMAKDVWYLGEPPAKAATLKLLGNQMLIFIVAGLADGFTMAGSAGVSADEALALFGRFKIQGALEFRAKKMAERDFKALFELAMARKDVRLMLETAAAGNVPLHVLPAIAARMDELLAAGHGEQDLAALGIDSVRAASAV
jgi:3-hydroxyisobutyrate dehydrogenase-like beta-hydroxyacid dehydrogenase